MIGSPEEPVVEESQATIDAQMQALSLGYIPVVMLPVGSTYTPAFPDHLRSIDIREGRGAGRYIFDPKQISVGQIIGTVKRGDHHKLLGHVQSKSQIIGTSVIVRAVSGGLVLQDSLVSDEESSIQAQIKSLRDRFQNSSVVVLREKLAAAVIQDRIEARPSVLNVFKEDKYRIGNLQAVGYLRTQTDMFPEGYLGRLYAKMNTGLSGKPGKSWLRRLFCGMPDVSYDAIVSYLATRPICIMGEWIDGEFHEAGLIFPTVNIGAGDQKASFAGYGFFREYWGTEKAKTLAVLGLSFFFVELGLCGIHGVRYDDNGLTKNFLTPFGFKDTGVLKRHMLRDGKLVDAIPSTLLREDFEAYCEGWLVDQYEAQRDDVDGLESSDTE